MWIPDRNEALAFLRTCVKQENLVRHMIATEAIMKALARKLGGDEQLWGLSGLLHDLDLELVGGDMHRHARETARILEEKGLPREGIDAILAHNGDTLGIPPKGNFHHALSAAETMTGMVVACTLVYPSKKIADVKAGSIRKRMKEHRFAANVSRERIMLIEKTGLSLDELIDISLQAMSGVAAEIGL